MRYLSAAFAVLAVLVLGACSSVGEDVSPTTPGDPATSSEGSTASTDPTSASSTVTGTATSPAPTSPQAATPPGSATTSTGPATTSGAATSTRPPVGLPGGIPGAEPLSPATENALRAVLAGESHVGGQAYRLEPDGDGWLVTVKVFDGARVVSVGADGETVLEVAEAAAGEETAALDTSRVFLAEAGEVALAESPGDLRSVVLAQTEDMTFWQVTVRTAQGEHELRIDPGSGEHL